MRLSPQAAAGAVLAVAAGSLSFFPGPVAAAAEQQQPRPLRFRQETNPSGSPTGGLSGTAPAIPASTAVAYKVQTPPLDTDWTYKVGTNPWREHPRPLLKRDAWVSLNGLWTWRAAKGAEDVASPPDGLLDREVMVPSCIQSGLSGLQELDTSYMWFARTFEIPRAWSSDDSLLLHFEAVDYEARVFINGIELFKNTGGYFRFSQDVGEHVYRSGKNLLTVFVHDPTDQQGFDIPIGKQTTRPSHIFYRACSGIWQTVWMERVPKSYIENLDISADMNGIVTMTVTSSKRDGSPVNITVSNEKGTEVASVTNKDADEQFTFRVNAPKLWSPDDPFLYNLTITMGDDKVSSYTGFRTISTGTVDGVKRPLINNEFVFLFGTLDQGYWPDGLYTPPSYEAMVYDLKLLKRLGMTMVRKHIKIEPDLFYRACDELGIIVIQDMPSLCADGRKPDPAQQEELERQFEIMVTEHRSYPSIGIWVIYNEGWGQLNNPPYPEERIAKRIRELDPTRLIDATSGWNDHGFGDFFDNHHYASPQCGTPYWSLPSGKFDTERIGFQGEFGGIGMNVSIKNLWNVKQAIDTIPDTYEIHETSASYNVRSRQLLDELRQQIELYSCNGAVWTQTTDVEGEVNGLMTYDRRVVRVDEQMWQEDIQKLYNAAARRGGKTTGFSVADGFNRLALPEVVAATGKKVVVEEPLGMAVQGGDGRVKLGV